VCYRTMEAKPQLDFLLHGLFNSEAAADIIASSPTDAFRKLFQQVSVEHDLKTTASQRAV
ncbi:MAG: hypothetical protein Q4C06_03245, partial [Bacillota bacterium]|nr:hypothetical protein [Bacillota bacterium]